MSFNKDQEQTLVDPGQVFARAEEFSRRVQESLTDLIRNHAEELTPEQLERLREVRLKVIEARFQNIFNGFEWSLGSKNQIRE